MDLQLDGKRAFVTGSTAGIGYAIAEALASEGANVIVNGRTNRVWTGSRVAQEERALEARCEGLPADLGTWQACAAAIQRIPGG